MNCVIPLVWGRYVSVALFAPTPETGVLGSLGLKKDGRYTRTHLFLLLVVVNDSHDSSYEEVFGLSSTQEPKPLVAII